MTVATATGGLEDVKRLREETQAGMLDCKKALAEAGGDFDKARDLLRKKGLAAAAKRADRVAAEGVIAASVSAGSGVIAEVKCETDFVARTPDFQDLGRRVVEALAGGASTEAAVALITEVAARCGEKCELGRTASFQLPAGQHGLVASYVHAGGKVGVLVELHCGQAATASRPELARLGKTLAMQVAVSRPQYLSASEVPAEVVAREKAIFLEQAAQDPKNANKPANILEKIIEGKLKKFTSEICLVDQEFMISAESDAKVVSEYVERGGKQLGDSITIARFSRLALGA